jgi:hypothetical protein
MKESFTFYAQWTSLVIVTVFEVMKLPSKGTRIVLLCLKCYHLNMKVARNDSTFSLSLVSSELRRRFSYMCITACSHHHQLILLTANFEWLCTCVLCTSASQLHKFCFHTCNSRILECSLPSHNQGRAGCGLIVTL